jgi:uncharacterized membrane protein
MDQLLDDIAPIFPQELLSEENDSDHSIAALAYPLFFIPLMMTEGSPEVTYHANQGLSLLLGYMTASIIAVILAAIAPAAAIIFGSLVGIPLLLATVLGIRHALKGQQSPLPLIGKVHLLK